MRAVLGACLWEASGAPLWDLGKLEVELLLEAEDVAILGMRQERGPGEAPLDFSSEPLPAS